MRWSRMSRRATRHRGASRRHSPRQPSLAIATCRFSFCRSTAGAPERQSVCRILSALHDVPLRFYPPWIAGGGKMELVAGPLANVHPLYGTDPRPAAGFNSGVFSVVGADAPGATKTAVHELGHALDFILHISTRPEWNRLFEAAARDGRTKLWGGSSRAGQLQPIDEYFAEMFAFTWTGLNWYVPRPVQDFIAFGLL